MLADEGALILKFWFHLGKKPQKKRLQALEADPKTRWRITQRDWKFFKKYDRFLSHQRGTFCARPRRAGRPGSWSKARTPLSRGDRWQDAARGDAQAPRPKAADRRAAQRSSDPAAADADGSLCSILDKLDLTQALPKARYRDELAKLQGRLALLTRQTEIRRTQRDLRVRGHGCGRQGRRDPAHHRARSMRVSTT